MNYFPTEASLDATLAVNSSFTLILPYMRAYNNGKAIKFCNTVCISPSLVGLLM